MILHGAALLIRARLQAQRIARVVVEDRQWMAALPIGERPPALEVHLPEHVRRWHLKALGCSRPAQRWHDPAVSSQNLMHSRERRNLHILAFQAGGDLARAPGWMSVADRKHKLLNRCVTAVRACVRSARAILQIAVS